MQRRSLARERVLRGGKIVFNGQSSIVDCTVRNLSAEGACLQVQSLVGIPQSFDLLIEGDWMSRPCRIVWSSQNRIGVSFHVGAAQRAASREPTVKEARSLDEMLNRRKPEDLIRSELLNLRAALEEVAVGIVLLDCELRAMFINRAFRRIWRLPDGKAESKPAFVALLYHGRDSRAYEVPSEGLDAYVAERVARVKAGDPEPMDLRLSNGEVIRLQCTSLPNGGRMLSYTPVTDIVRPADELKVLTAAFDHVAHGVIVLDRDLRVRFMNQQMRDIWQLSEDSAAALPSFPDLVRNAARRVYGVPIERLRGFVAERIEAVRDAKSKPVDIPLTDGRIIRAKCSSLPDGGRMLSYADVTDLVKQSEALRTLATTDSLTDLFNRRHFLALADQEWTRFQRYHRPLSLMMIDIDGFKSINDRYGHAVGDTVLRRVADVCQETRRGTDIVARLGGDEFVLLLPESNAGQASKGAERLRSKLKSVPVAAEGFSISLSIGLAEARLSMSNVGALMKLADTALYRAKAAGRDCVAFAEAESDASPKLAAE